MATPLLKPSQAGPVARTEVTTHACAVCTRKVPWRLLMCGQHWRLVPSKEQLAVYRCWGRLNRTRGMSKTHMQLLTHDYNAARDAAVAAAVEALKPTKDGSDDQA